MRKYRHKIRSRTTQRKEKKCGMQNYVLCDAVLLTENERERQSPPKCLQSFSCAFPLKSYEEIASFSLFLPEKKMVFRYGVKVCIVKCTEWMEVKSSRFAHILWDLCSQKWNISNKQLNNLCRHVQSVESPQTNRNFVWNRTQIKTIRQHSIP